MQQGSSGRLQPLQLRHTPQSSHPVRAVLGIALRADQACEQTLAALCTASGLYAMVAHRSTLPDTLQLLLTVSSRHIGLSAEPAPLPLAHPPPVTCHPREARRSLQCHKGAGPLHLQLTCLCACNGQQACNSHRRVEGTTWPPAALSQGLLIPTLQQCGANPRGRFRVPELISTLQRFAYG